MRFAHGALLAVLLAGVSFAADPPAPAPSFDQLLAKLADQRKQKAELAKAEAATIAQLKAFYKDATDKLKAAGILDPVPPTPPGPKPPGPGPAPGPLTSFHVILVYESFDTMTPEQRAVVYGKVVEDYLTANCTGGKSGWRRRDKDAPGDADPTMAALWSAVQPKVTVTPCIVIERNGKADILNLEATPAKMVETLAKYRGQ